MKTRVLLGIATQTVVMGTPLLFAWLLESILLFSIALGAAMVWMLYLVRRGAPSQTRLFIFYALMVNFAFFTLLPAGRVWSYLAAGATLLLFVRAYREESVEMAGAVNSNRSADGDQISQVTSLTEQMNSTTELLNTRADLLRRHDSVRLASFVIAATCRTLSRTAEVQELDRTSSSEFVVQCRYHYDCMWWLHLVDSGIDEQDVAKLFPLVSDSLSIMLSEPGLGQDLRPLLSAMADPSRVSASTIREAFSAYVLGQLPEETKELLRGDQPIDHRWRHALLFMLTLEERIPKIAGKKEITLGVIEESLASWDNPLLVEFDFWQCPIIELPQSYLE